MCQEGITREITQQLETLIEIDPQCYDSRVCRGLLLWLQEHFEQANRELEQAIPLEQKPWEAYFWNGLVEASLGRDGQAIAAVEKALKRGLPPVLLTPLRWLQQERLDFCEKYVKTLFDGYKLAM
jgi:tetratricopeptide (TPR) repeat protein